MNFNTHQYLAWSVLKCRRTKHTRPEFYRLATPAGMYTCIAGLAWSEHLASNRHIHLLFMTPSMSIHEEANIQVSKISFFKKEILVDILVYNRLSDGSLENATCARGTDRAKLSASRGKSRLFSWFSSVSRVHSATSNEANKSAMRREEWTITARRAVLRLAQMKYQYFVPERCK